MKKIKQKNHWPLQPVRHRKKNYIHVIVVMISTPLGLCLDLNISKQFVGHPRSSHDFEVFQTKEKKKKDHGY